MGFEFSDEMVTRLRARLPEGDGVRGVALDGQFDQEFLAEAADAIAIAIAIAIANGLFDQYLGMAEARW